MSFSLIKLLGFVSLLDDLNAVIVAASVANTVRTSILAAMCALYKSGSFQLPNVGTSLISAGFRCFCLRYCHGYTSWSADNRLSNIFNT